MVTGTQTPWGRGSVSLHQVRLPAESGMGSSGGDDDQGGLEASFSRRGEVCPANLPLEGFSWEKSGTGIQEELLRELNVSLEDASSAGVDTPVHPPEPAPPPGLKRSTFLLWGCRQLTPLQGCPLCGW